MNTQDKAKHTPGPWMWNQSLGIKDGGNRLICTMRGEHLKQREANARLIATAPKMLAVIESGLEAVNAYGDGLPDGYGLPRCLSDWLEWAEAVLKEARGE